MEKIIELKDVYKNYQVGELELQVLKGISLEFYKNEFVVILGPSGSGKSTMLNILGGIDQMSYGDMIFKGKSLQKASDKTLTEFRRNHIGFVFQFYNLIPNLNVKENINMATELSNNPINTDELIQKIDLKDKADYFPSQMSGGQQQRVAIARALAKNPDILLCDEPTGALDMKTGASILNLLYRFYKDYGKTVIIITHNADYSVIADRTIYIKDGLIDKIDINKNPIEPNEVKW